MVKKDFRKYIFFHIAALHVRTGVRAYMDAKLLQQEVFSCDIYQYTGFLLIFPTCKTSNMNKTLHKKQVLTGLKDPELCQHH